MIPREDPPSSPEEQPVTGLGLRDRIPGGLGRASRAIVRAGLWTPVAAAGFDTFEEWLECTRPSRRFDPPATT